MLCQNRFPRTKLKLSKRPSTCRPPHWASPDLCWTPAPRHKSAAFLGNRVVEAAQYTPTESLGTTDDCGFSPFADDTSTLPEIALAKVKNRVERTAMLVRILSV